jgi:DNA-binding Lrp family transcriptional regulator
MRPDTQVLDAVDRRLVLATQAGLPLVARPYDVVAAAVGIDEQAVRARLARMLRLGVIRRIGAVPNHYALGYVANGMTVWDVDDAQVDRLGADVGQLPFVTHCYRRPRQPPLWPYNLFAMIHGRSRPEVDALAAIVRQLLGPACRADEAIFSSRVLKKTGLRLAGARVDASPPQADARAGDGMAPPHPRRAGDARGGEPAPGA